MPTIFISYRRTDSASDAGRLYDRLVERYGRASVFKDVDSIPPGVNFADYLADALQTSDVALVVIGPRWLEAASGWRRRRLDDPADFVRVQIETALRLGLTVIPVLVSGAQLPGARHLPVSLRPLLLQNGIPLRQDPDFNHDVERVIAAVDYWQAQPRRRKPISAAPSDQATQTSATPASDRASAADEFGNEFNLEKSSLDATSPAHPVARLVATTVAHPEAPRTNRTNRTNRSKPMSTNHLMSGMVATAVMVLIVIAIVVINGRMGIVSAFGALRGGQRAGVTHTPTVMPTITPKVTPNLVATIEANDKNPSQIKSLTLGYSSANPGCNTTYWTSALTVKPICASSGMTITGVDNPSNAVNGSVSETRDYFTIRVTVSNLQGGCAITLRGDSQTLTLALQQQLNDVSWSLQAAVNPYTISGSLTSGTIPTASAYSIVMQFTSNDYAFPNDLALSINGTAIPTTGKINVAPNGAWYSYNLGLLQNVALSLYSAGAQSASSGHASATFSNFSFTAS